MTTREDSTLIRVSKDTWRELNKRKDVGDSFDSVLKKTLGITHEKEAAE